MEIDISLIDKKRKLASIQIISKIEQIPSFPKLESASVLGWKVAIEKGEFSLNQKIVFIEIDSLLPNNEQWSQKLKLNNYKVTQQKFGKNFISQGLILPLSILENKENNISINEYQIGTDVTSILNIKKYNNDSDLKLPKGIQISKLPFPKNLIEKSDEERIQSVPNYIFKFKGKSFYSTLKYDGTSATYLINPYNNLFYICSRNQVREYNNKDFYTQIANIYNIENKLRKLNGKYAIQGEIYGPNIQKNKLCVDKLKFVIFSIKDIENNRYLDLDEMISICKDLDLNFVDIIERGDNFNYSLNELIEKSKGKYEGTDNFREGLVYRLQKDWNSDKGRFSFKVINVDYKH